MAISAQDLNLSVSDGLYAVARGKDNLLSLEMDGLGVLALKEVTGGRGGGGIE
jgi:hypothetical protein